MPNEGPIHHRGRTTLSTAGRCYSWCVSKRMSLTLERADEEAVAPFTHDSPERAILTTLSPTTALNSEAAVLRALIRIGAEAIQERILAQGYADLAEEYRAHDEERPALRKRRTERDAHRD